MGNQLNYCENCFNSKENSAKPPAALPNQSPAKKEESAPLVKKPANQDLQSQPNLSKENDKTDAKP